MKVPWQAWYGDMEENLSFPAGWQVTLASMADAPELGDRAVDHALRNPIGTPSLNELAKGVSQAAIVVEDITRPSPTAQILAKILAQLEDGGLGRERVRIIVGTGAHTPMHRSELLKKLGPGVLESGEVFQHQPYENLEYLGETERGTPIHIDRAFLDADLRIGVGTITPHVTYDLSALYHEQYPLSSVDYANRPQVRDCITIARLLRLAPADPSQPLCLWMRKCCWSPGTASMFETWQNAMATASGEQTVLGIA